MFNPRFNEQNDPTKGLRRLTKFRQVETLCSDSAVAGNVMREITSSRKWFAIAVGPEWQKATGESYADSFAVAAVHTLYGKEAALDTLDRLIDQRVTEKLEAIRDHAEGNGPLLESHYTAASLVELRSIIKNGDLGRAIEAHECATG